MNRVLTSVVLRFTAQEEAQTTIRGIKSSPLENARNSLLKVLGARSVLSAIYSH